MTRHKNSIILTLLISMVFLATTHVYAESAQDIKARMKARLPEINQLKAAGILGEGKDGFLSFVGSATEKASVVNSENDDRKKVYIAIANQQGTTPELVGSRRALQISQKAAPGTWVQDSSGGWVKK